MNHERAAVQLGDPVPMTPHSGEHIEIRASITRSVRVVPEEHGHARQRFGDHHFAHLVPYPFTPAVPCLNVRPEVRALKFAAVHGLVRVGPHEGARDVRSTGVGPEPHVVGD